jgi:hypothetical protein
MRFKATGDTSNLAINQINDMDQPSNPIVYYWDKNHVIYENGLARLCKKSMQITDFKASGKHVFVTMTEPTCETWYINCKKGKHKCLPVYLETLIDNPYSDSITGKTADGEQVTYELSYGDGSLDYTSDGEWELYEESSEQSEEYSSCSEDESDADYEMDYGDTMLFFDEAIHRTKTGQWWIECHPYLLFISKEGRQPLIYHANSMGLKFKYENVVTDPFKVSQSGVLEWVGRRIVDLHEQYLIAKSDSGQYNVYHFGDHEGELVIVAENVFYQAPFCGKPADY